MLDRTSAWNEFCDHRALAAADKFAKDVGQFLLETWPYRGSVSMQEAGSQFAAKFAKLFLVHFREQFSITLLMQELDCDCLRSRDSCQSPVKVILRLVCQSICGLFQCVQSFFHINIQTVNDVYQV